MDRREAGRLGIKAAIAKDPKHQSNAGKAGFAATVARHWGGDAKSYVDYLHRRAHESQIEALTDIQLRGELAKGKEISSVELPVLEDYEPINWRDKVKASKEDSMMDLPW